MTTELKTDRLADELLDIAAVAELCQVSQRAILRWIRRGDIVPPLRVGRRFLRFRRADIERWLAESVVLPTEATDAE